MVRKEEKTLTGGIGNLSLNGDETLTGGIGTGSDNSATFTGGIGVETPDAATLTGGIGVETPDAATLTGGIGVESPDAETLTGGQFLRKQMESAEKSSQPRRAGAVTPEREAPKKRSASESDWDVGDVIDDKYEVIEMIGQGGMGVVFKIRHLAWNIDMAVKMPLGKLLSNPAYKLRFVRESQTWVDLGLHPNIVQCWYVRDMGGVPRLFMDYVRGGSLRDRVKGRQIGMSDWATILDMAIQAADGLAYAHERGVVHRDIKPANMLITKDGRLCVTDFGLVKVSGESEIDGETTGARPAENAHCAIDRTPPGLTRTGALLGTPEYSAPEQWDKADSVDARTDIYALGIVLFEMCCGRRPFDNGKHRDPPLVLMGRHKYSPVPNPLKFNKKIEKPIIRTILRCLAKDVGERPESMAAFRKELAGVYQEVVGKPYPRPVPEPGDLRADSLNNKAVSMWDLGKKKEALAALENALECDPQHLEATRNLCVFRWKEGTITDRVFMDRLEALEAVHGTRADYWRHSGEAQFARGDLAEAESALEKALKIDTNDTDAACLLAEIRNACRKKPAGPGPAIDFKGHTGAVNCLCQGKEPHYYYSGGSDGKIGLWETNSGKILAFFPMHKGPVNAVAISPNGQVGLSAGADGTVNLWNATTGKHLRTIRGHSDAVNFVCFTPDGRFALSGSSDTTLKLWDIATEKCVKEYTGHDGPVTCAAITPDGQTVLSSNANWSYAGTRKTDTRFHLPTVTEIPLRLWNVDDGECRFALKGHTGNVYTVAVSPDGRFGLSGGDDRIVRVWQLSTGRQIRTLEGHVAPIMSATFGPNGVISGGQDKTMRLWDLETGRCSRTFEGHSDSVTSVAFLSKGFAMTGSRDGLMKMWRIRFPYKIPSMALSKIKELKMLKEERNVCSFLANKADTCLDRGEISEAVEVLRKAREIEGFERDPELLALWNRAADQSVRIGLRSAWPAKILEGHSDAINCVAVTSDGRYCLSGSSDKSVGLWDLAKGKCVRYLRWYSFMEEGLSVRKFEGRTDSVYSVAIDPEGLSCVSGGYFKNLLVWNLCSGECVRVLDGHADSVNSVAISPDGRTVLSGSRDKTMILWDHLAGRRIRTLEGHVDPVNTVAISPNSGFALSGGEDGFVRLWKLASGECVHVLKGHSAGVNTVAFSPDGWLGISGSSDGSLRLWHLISGKSLLALKGKAGPIYSATITPDGRYALSAAGRTVQVWDLLTGERLRSIEGHSGIVNAVAVGSNGRYAFTGSTDKRLIVWELDWDLRQCGTAPSLTDCYGINQRQSFSLACKQLKGEA